MKRLRLDSAARAELLHEIKYYETTRTGTGVKFREGVLRAQLRPCAMRPVGIAPVKGSTLRKLPTRLCRRSFGLPTALAPAHNLLGQQGLKISILTIDRLAGGSV